jgi:hypothetical protein
MKEKKIKMVHTMIAENQFLSIKIRDTIIITDTLFHSLHSPFKDEAQTALFKGPVRTAL